MSAADQLSSLTPPAPTLPRRRPAVTLRRHSRSGVWRSATAAAATAATAMALLLAACSGGDGGSDDKASTTTTKATTTTSVADRSGEPIVTTTVFSAGEDGYATYRIPAVVRAGDGTLIAFAEARVASAADHGDVDLIAKRSTDDGVTWGELQVVADMGSDFIGNPSPVLHEESGRLVLLATFKNAADQEMQILSGTGIDTSRQYLLTSDDAGETWSEPTEITEAVKRPEWRWYSVGPGHAFQLHTGPNAGRLVAAANHSDEAMNYGAHLLFSDDGGKTWSIGASDTPQGGPMHPNEATAAQVADGTIVVSARDQGGLDEWHRLQTTSTDGGESFTGPFENQQGLVTPVVQGSILWLDLGTGAGSRSEPDQRGDGILLFSAPSHGTDRVNLMVRTSSDGGATWKDGLLLREGPSGYSDLLALPGHAVGVLYETGDATAVERIDFVTFGADKLSG